MRWGDVNLQHKAVSYGMLILFLKINASKKLGHRFMAYFLDFKEF
jgi:hypothetical protein